MKAPTAGFANIAGSALLAWLAFTMKLVQHLSQIGFPERPARLRLVEVRLGYSSWLITAVDVFYVW